MLSIYRYRHLEDRDQFFERLRPDQETWLVSDLKSKSEYQGRLLEKYGGYEDHSVFRASELWRLLFRRLRPEFGIVSRDLMKTWLESFLRSASEDSQQNLLSPRSAKTYLTMIDLLAPVFAHPQGAERLAEFFEQQPEAADRWKEWAELAFGVWQILMQEKMVLVSWLPALLRQQELSRVWHRPLWIDLGGDLRQVEIELLQNLSQHLDVRIFVPELVHQDSFSFLLRPAEMLWESTLCKTVLTSPERPSHFEFGRYTGPLAQAKATVATARRWLDEGLAPHEIAIVAPDLEKDWPLLEPLFALEGIPVQKDQVVRLHSLPSVANWLARLRLHTGQVQFSEIELAYSAEELEIRYEKFRSIFRQALDEQDLMRDQDLHRRFFQQRLEYGKITLADFFVSASHFWRDEDDWKGFEQILEFSMKEVPTQLKLEARSWTSFVESVAGQKEFTLGGGESRGIWILNLSSAEGARARRRIFINLAESHFRKNSSILVGARDLSRLGHGFGFFLDHPEQSLQDFELSWALQNPSELDCLFFAATQVTGAVDGPHALWLRMGGGHQTKAPDSTRMDELLRRDSWPLAVQQEKERHCVSTWLPNFDLRFSASSLEKFRQCSFAWAAERRFRLLDLPDQDFDLDPRDRGTLIHALFRALTQQPRRAEWTESELSTLLDQLREQLHLTHRQSWMWEVDRAKYIELAKRFQKYDLAWLQEHPLVSIRGLEQKFEFYFDPKTQEFSNGPQEGRIHLTGSIDRLEVDHLGSAAVVVDYKSSLQTQHGFEKWIEQNFIQLAFYGWVVERGFLKDSKQSTLVGAQILAYKKMQRGRGFLAPLKSQAWSDSSTSKTLTERDLPQYWTEFENLIRDLINDALQGKIFPRPFQDKIQICERCQWSGLCRAPHLL